MKQNLKRFVGESSVIKLKIQEVINASMALRQIAGTKLPILVSFSFSLFLKGLQPIFESYNESRLKLLEEFGTLNKEKNEYDFKEGNKAKYEKKYLELIEGEVDVKVPEIKLADLGDTKIEPATLENIIWLFKE
jgi:hypothetical protein